MVCILGNCVKASLILNEKCVDGLNKNECGFSSPCIINEFTIETSPTTITSKTLTTTIISIGTTSTTTTSTTTTSTTTTTSSTTTTSRTTTFSRTTTNITSTITTITSTMTTTSISTTTSRTTTTTTTSSTKTNITSTITTSSSSTTTTTIITTTSITKTTTTTTSSSTTTTKTSTTTTSTTNTTASITIASTTTITSTTVTIRTTISTTSTSTIIATSTMILNKNFIFLISDYPDKCSYLLESLAGCAMLISTNTTTFYVIGHIYFHGFVYVFNDNWNIISYFRAPKANSIMEVGKFLYISTDYYIYKTDSSLNTLARFIFFNSFYSFFQGIYFNSSNNLIYVASRGYHLIFRFDLDLNFYDFYDISTESYRPYSINGFKETLYVGEFHGGNIVVMIDNKIIYTFNGCLGQYSSISMIFINPNGLIANVCEDSHAVFMYFVNGTYANNYLYTEQNPKYIGVNSKGIGFVVSENGIHFYENNNIFFNAITSSTNTPINTNKTTYLSIQNSTNLFTNTQLPYFLQYFNYTCRKSFQNLGGCAMLISTKTTTFYVSDRDGDKVFMFKDNWSYITFFNFPSPICIIVVGRFLYISSGDAYIYKTSNSLNILARFTTNHFCSFSGIYFNSSNNLIYVASYVGGLNKILRFDLNLNFYDDFTTQSYRPYSINGFKETLYVGEFFGGNIVVMIDNKIIYTFNGCLGQYSSISMIFINPNGLMVNACWDSHAVYMYYVNGTYANNIYYTQYPKYIGVNSKGLGFVVSEYGIHFYEKNNIFFNTMFSSATSTVTTTMSTTINTTTTPSQKHSD